jgi:hypothetical protein
MQPGFFGRRHFMHGCEGLEKCMNPACHCTVGPGQRYCSQYCEAEAELAGKPAHDCQCGHAFCEEART